MTRCTNGSLTHPEVVYMSKSGDGLRPIVITEWDRFILEKVNTIAFTHVLTRGPSLSGNEGSVCSQDRGEVLTASLHYWTDSDGGCGSTWRESTAQRVWTEGREWVSEIVAISVLRSQRDRLVASTMPDMALPGELLEQLNSVWKQLDSIH